MNFAMVPRPQNIFFAKTNLCTCSKRIAALFSFFLQILPFYRPPNLRKIKHVFSWPSQKGSGLIPDLTSQSDLHTINFFINMRAKYNRRPFWPCAQPVGQRWSKSKVVGSSPAHGPWPTHGGVCFSVLVCESISLPRVNAPMGQHGSFSATAT